MYVVEIYDHLFSLACQTIDPEKHILNTSSYSILNRGGQLLNRGAQLLNRGRRLLNRGRRLLNRGRQLLNRGTQLFRE